MIHLKNISKINKQKNVFIIAEACDNHFGSLSRAIEMVKKAKSSGANCIKFQHHLPDEEMLPNSPMSSNFTEPLYKFLKKNALKLSDHIKLKSYCEKINISYLCTPFSLKAAEELYSIGCRDFKIGSGEMTDIPTLLKISKFARNMIISTGMSELKEINRTYRALKSSNAKISLMHCVSEYPTKYKDLNLNFINVMKKKFKNLKIGHSDHTSDIYSSIAAVAVGAEIIEKHVTLNKNLKGPDKDVSISFGDLKILVSQIRNIEKSLGSKKIIHKKEKQIRKWAFRSIISTKEILKGERISSNKIWSKRPGTGIPSYLMQKIIGKKAKRNIPNNTLLAWGDIK